ALMEKYFAAADQILDRFFGTELSSSVDGRIQEQARVSREKMFGLNPNEWRKSDYVVAPPKGTEPREAARLLITTFTRKAYRGQSSDTDIQRLLELFDKSTANGNGYGDSIRLTLKAILVSPRFLYRIEGIRKALTADSDSADAAFPVDDQELAVRLSY